MYKDKLLCSEDYSVYIQKLKIIYNVYIIYVLLLFLLIVFLFYGQDIFIWIEVDNYNLIINLLEVYDIFKGWCVVLNKYGKDK